MASRQLYIKQAKELRTKHNNLVILKHDNSTIELPLEDINSIFLEDSKTLISARLLTDLSEYQISLIMCNEKYFPTSISLPLNKHYNQYQIFKKQINSSQSLKDNLWKTIIKRKIENQVKVLEYTTNEKNSIDLLNNYIKEVKVGDKDNKEAIAARVFFTSIYGKEFVRFGSNAISSALNYGYSILHGAIVRNLVSMGFTTMLGIWHESEKNAFNLASDLIETFRPIVDYYIFWNIDKIDIPLSKDIRADLINLLNAIVIIDSKECTVEYAINICCISYLTCLEENDYKKIKLPIIKDINLLGNE